MPAPAPEPDDRRSPWPIVLLVLALVAAIVLLVVLLTRGDGEDPSATQADTSSAPTSSAPTTEDTPSEESSSAPAEITLDEGDYIGRDIDEVAADLKALGLKVDAQPIDNPGGEEADTVSSVSPTSGLVKGSTVTVEYYREAEPTSEPPTSEPTSESPSDTSSPSTPSSPSSSASQAQDSGNPTTSASAAAPSASGSRGAPS